jgi:hypothetical protein
VAVALQLGDELALARDMPRTVGHVPQQHVTGHAPS